MPQEQKKIKIAFLSDILDRRPQKTSFPRRLIEDLLNRPEFEIYLLHYKSMPDDPIYKRANEIIFPKVSLPWGSHFASFMKFCLTTKLNFDIFHIFVSRPYPFFWLMPAKKFVIMAHGGGSVTAPVIFTVPNMIFNFVMKHFNKYIDAVIGVSEYGSREIAYAYHMPPEKIFTIYNVLDFVYRPFPKDKIADVFFKYKIKADKYFLYVGGMQIHKNAKGAIESYILLREKNPEIKEKLIMVGNYSKEQAGKFRDDIGLKKTKYFDDIIFTGFVDLKDLPAFHSGATALVFPSFNEGFGMPVLEAMTCGNAVITSNTTSLPEVAGNAAILVNPYDNEDIMNAMKEVATDSKKREELIKRGFERAKFFTWNNCVNNYIALFKGILYKK